MVMEPSYYFETKMSGTGEFPVHAGEVWLWVCATCMAWLHLPCPKKWVSFALCLALLINVLAGANSMHSTPS